MRLALGLRNFKANPGDSKLQTLCGLNDCACPTKSVEFNREEKGGCGSFQQESRLKIDPDCFVCMPGFTFLLLYRIALASSCRMPHSFARSPPCSMFFLVPSNFLPWFQVSWSLTLPAACARIIFSSISVGAGLARSVAEATITPGTQPA